MKPHRGGLCIAPLLALLALALAAGIATASRSIELGPESGELGRVTARAAGSRAASLTFVGREFEVICEVTLTLALNSAIAKTNGARAGSVTAARVSEGFCVGGKARFIGLPWTITYRSFAGTLPTITAIELVIRNVDVLFEAFFEVGRCRYEGSATVTTTGNPIRSFSYREASSQLLFKERLGMVGPCPREELASIKGAMTLAPTLRMSLL